MKRIALVAALALAACQNGGSADNAAVANTAAAEPVVQAQPIWLRASDGIAVKGAFYRADKAKAIILLFHQAGSDKGEYATIAPRLVKAGYSALAIDQRQGGDMFGHNETVAKIGHQGDMVDAMADLQAAVDWARPLHQPVILWGSSYSASLVFPVADSNVGLVKAVLAFSPGEYFPDKTLTGRAAETLSVPAFITSAPDAGEVAKARAIAAKVKGGRATVYVPAAGVHGSSTLIAAKNAKGAEANWQAVMAFLTKVAP